jgi:[ribosomal protein S5]-alanine N-acetyltransferase
MSAYFLTSERLGFRWWMADDLPLALELWGNAEVTRLFTKEPLNEEQVREKLLRELHNDKVYGFQYWPMFMRETHTFASCCGLRSFEPEKNICEMGYHLLPSYWGRGLATETAQAVIEYAFSTLMVRGLSAGHHPDNLPSRRILLKLGFTETGAEFYEPTGLLHPGYMLLNT